MSDGRTYRIRSPSPYKVIRLKKDKINDPNINPLAEKDAYLEESKVSKFRRKFSGFSIYSEQEKKLQIEKENEKIKIKLAAKAAKLAEAQKAKEEKKSKQRKILKTKSLKTWKTKK